MKNYQNATRTGTNATFVEVGEQTDSLLTIQNKVGSFTPTPGSKVEMVSGTIRVSVPAEDTPCGASCATKILESAEIRYNFRKGGTNLTALVDEVVRVLGIAVSDYHLNIGLVPPSEATFTEV